MNGDPSPPPDAAPALGERATAGPRRGAIDVARVGALGVVVLGHLLMAVIDRAPDGELRGANLLALRPGWSWLGVLSPMPVFFAAAGWANRGSGWQDVVPRVRALVGFAAVVVAVWSALVLGTAAVLGDPGVVGDGARIATQPFWFLAAYVPLLVAGPVVDRLARRPVATTAVILALVATADLARFGLGWSDLWGWPGFFLVWGLPWVLGTWWRRRFERGAFHERLVGSWLGSAGVVGAVLLVHLGGYSAALIDVVPSQRSNSTPPTLYTAVVAVAQVGVLMAAAPCLDRLAARWPRVWHRAGTAAVGVYALHLSALALCAAVIAAGLWVPTRLTATFWLTRPVWVAAVLGTTGALMAIATAAQGRFSSRSDDPPVRRPAHAVVMGVVLTTFGGAAVGLVGPRTPSWAIVCAAALTGAWALLRSSGNRR